MEIIKKTDDPRFRGDGGIQEVPVIKFDPADEVHVRRLNRVFKESGIIFTDVAEFISFFEKEGIHFVVEMDDHVPSGIKIPTLDQLTNE